MRKRPTRVGFQPTNYRVLALQPSPLGSTFMYIAKKNTIMYKSLLLTNKLYLGVSAIGITQKRRRSVKKSPERPKNILEQKRNNCRRAQKPKFCTFTKAKRHVYNNCFRFVPEQLKVFSFSNISFLLTDTYRSWKLIFYPPRDDKLDLIPIRIYQHESIGTQKEH